MKNPAIASRATAARCWGSSWRPRSPRRCGCRWRGFPERGKQIILLFLFVRCFRGAKKWVSVRVCFTLSYHYDLWASVCFVTEAGYFFCQPWKKDDWTSAQAKTSSKIRGWSLLINEFSTAAKLKREKRLKWIEKSKMQRSKADKFFSVVRKQDCRFANSVRKIWPAANKAFLPLLSFPALCKTEGGSPVSHDLCH